jgi:ceramide glucosyltransferase
VEVARQPVFNVTRHRKVREFVRRFQRWSVMQRFAVGTPTYVAQALLQPSMLALLGFLVSPSRLSGLALVACVVMKSACDFAVATILRPGGFSAGALFALPLREVLITWAWMHGLWHDTVDWRGHPLRVLAGTRLALPEPEPTLEVEPDIREAA